LKHNDAHTTNQIITLLDIILNQNYFSFRCQIYKPDKGEATGSPISGTIVEIFLHLEEIHIRYLIESNILAFYTRYVDDVLIVYGSTLTTPENIRQYLDTIHYNIQLSLRHETNSSVSFLDLTITRTPTCLDIGVLIYCKPTATDTTINFLFNHHLNKNLLHTDSSSDECSSSPSTMINSKKNGKTYYALPTTTIFPTP
jgi:hypothetical protein